MSRVLTLLVCLALVMVGAACSPSVGTQSAGADYNEEAAAHLENAAALREGVQELESEANTLDDFFFDSWTECPSDGGAMIHEDDFPSSDFYVVPDDVYYELLRRAEQFDNTNPIY